jgi:hypothetical protein
LSQPQTILRLSGELPWGTLLARKRDQVLSACRDIVKMPVVAGGSRG